MKWVLTRTNDEYLTYLSKKTGISKILAQILVGRGIKEPSQVKDFLNPSIQLLSDPFSIPGLRRAVERIKVAIKNNERILVHGDYDADGLTGTAMMVQGLRRLGADVHFFIPSRLRDGYGFNEPGLKRAVQLGASLIITVDCGIKSFTTAREAQKYGIDLIITDHHIPSFVEDKDIGAEREVHLISVPVLPLATAVVNPKLKVWGLSEHKGFNQGCPMETSESMEGSTVHLSGAGVVFKVLQGLYGNLDSIIDLLDLVAIGTSGDIVPLIGENRKIIKEGLEVLKNTERKGLRVLLELSGIRHGVERLSPDFLSFTLIPRLNAAGRISDNPGDAVNLLLTEEEGVAEELGLWLDRLNRQRQAIEEEIYEEALEVFKKKYEEIPDVIVLYKEGWHPGVIGIIASKFQEEFFRPTFIFSLKDGIATGSARSIPQVNIIKILDSLEGFLIRYGGHSQAAGLSLHEDNLKDFEDSLSKEIKKTLEGERPVPTLKIDAEVFFKDIDFRLIKELRDLEPLGYGNEEPLLGAKDIHPVDSRIVGNGHLKLRLRQGPQEFDVIGFGMADMIDLTSGPVDIAFLPQINEYNGKRTIQLKIRAIRKSEGRD